MKAEVKKYNGLPTIFINGRPHAGLTYATYTPEKRWFNSIRKTGIEVIEFSATSDFAHYGEAKPVRLSQDVFDYQDFDKRAETAIKACPDIYLMPRLSISSPPWWDKEHPDELLTYHDGSHNPNDRFNIQMYAKMKIPRSILGGDISLDPSVPLPAYCKDSVPSWASLVWREETGMTLRKLIRHIFGAPYSERVIGFLLMSGNTNEWYHWGTYTEKFPDYSKPQKHAFRRWLREKYKSIDALREKWHNGKIEFDKVEIPSREKRATASWGQLRDPRREQHVIDYYQFHSEIVVDTISYFARVIKDETENNFIVGAFYGYIMEICWHPYGLLNGGSLALNKLLGIKEIDFVTTPPSYVNRSLGNGVSAFNSATESIKMHGKILMNDNDMVTHLNRPKTDFMGESENMDVTTALHLRELSNTICHGANMAWLDWGGGWFDDAEVSAFIQKLCRIGKMSMKHNRSSVAEIAAVIDEESLFYMPCDNALTSPLLYLQKMEFFKTGAPIDIILLSDLEKARNYKMYMFLNTFNLTSKQRGIIKAKLAKKTNLALWVYAPGFYKDGDGSIEHIRELVGMNILMDTVPMSLRVQITNEASDKVPGLKAYSLLGTDRAIAPVFYIEDPSADTLGVFKDGGERVGFAVKKGKNLVNVYSSAPCLSGQILRSLAKLANVHLYIDTDDVLYANASFVAIHTKDGGKKTLRFPEPVDVYDTFNDKVIARSASKVTVSLPEKTSHLYFFGNKGKWVRGL